MTDVNHDTAVGLKPGEMLSQYRIEQPVGRGGQGTVWKAYDTKLDRAVAIKQVPPAQASDPEYVAAFRQECRILARIGPKCPHIVAIFDFIEDESGLYSVMEFVDGQTLDAMLGAEQLSDRDKVEVLGQLLTSLHECHNAGVIHRDIKPQNILLEPAPGSPGFHLRLTDFGVATTGGAGALPMGTTKYMAPENFRGGAVDARVDLYAAGFLAYEMFGGRAFEKAFADIMTDPRNEHLRWMQWHTGSKQAPPAANLRPNVAEVRIASPIIERLIAKDPAARFASAAEALAELKNSARSAPPPPAAAAESPPAAASPSGRSPASREPAASMHKPPPPPQRMVASAKVGGGAMPAHDERTDTKRLPGVTPWFLKPVYLAAMAAAVAALVLIVLSLTKKDPIAEVQQQALAAYKAERWQEAAARHRDLADAVRTHDSGNEKALRRITATAELCEALHIAGHDPDKAMEIARRTGAIFEELGFKNLQEKSYGLTTRLEPKIRFGETLATAVQALGARDRARAATYIAQLQELNEKSKLGEERRLGVLNRIRLAYDTGATLSQSLDRVAGALTNGEITSALESELGDISSRFQSLISTCDELAVAMTGFPQFTSLGADILRVRDEAKERKTHADSVLDFHKTVKETRPAFGAAVAAIRVLDDPKAPKNLKVPPGQLIELCRPRYERAVSIAQVMTEKRLAGVPPALATEAQRNLQLCIDAGEYLGLRNVADAKTGLTNTTTDNLAKYFAVMDKIRNNGNLEALGASRLLNAIEAEQGKRDNNTKDENRAKRLAELNQAAVTAKSEGKPDKEIEAYQTLVKEGFNLGLKQGRLTHLLDAMALKPKIDAHAKDLAAALEELGKSIKEESRVSLPGPTAGDPTVRFGDLVEGLEKLETAARTDIADARKPGPFESDAYFKNALTPAARDYDAVQKTALQLRGLEIEVGDWIKIMKSAERAVPGKKGALWVDAKNLGEKIARAGLSLTGPPADVRRRVGDHLAKLADYEIGCVTIKNRITAGENSRAAALKTSGAERERYYDIARKNVEDAVRLSKALPFPLDPVLQTRLEVVVKDLPKGGPAQ